MPMDDASLAPGDEEMNSNPMDDDMGICPGHSGQGRCDPQQNLKGYQI